MNRYDGEVKLHPFVLYEGSNTRQNLELTLGIYTEPIRDMEGKEVTVGGELVKIKLFALFDLSALNSIIGKQNHAASYPCAWTTVSKDHLSSKYHAGKPHNEKDCKDIRFLNERDYETNLTHHIVRQEGKKSAKNVKDTGSVVASNIFPLQDTYRYVPPLMNRVAKCSGYDCVKAGLDN